MLLPKHLIPAVERTMNRATTGGMRIHTTVGRAEDGVARFSIQDILSALDLASVQVAARVRSEETPSLVQAITPVGGSFDLSNSLRLDGTGQSVNGEYAYRRTLASNDVYSADGRAPSDTDPAWVFEGGVLDVIGDSVNGSGAQATHVQVPQTTATTASATKSGGTITGFQWEEYHEETVFLIDAGAHEGRLVDWGTGEVDTAAPDGTVNVTAFRHACVDLPVNLEEAVVEYAVYHLMAGVGPRPLSPEGGPTGLDLAGQARENAESAIRALEMDYFLTRDVTGGE
jgi:hypothetical protein